MAKGTLALRQIQLGDNADTSKNFVISVPAVADGTLTIERENGTDVLTIDANGVVSGNVGVGAGQTWKNMIGSRAYNTTYTNDTGRPITVFISAVSNTAGFLTILVIDGKSVIASSYQGNANVGAAVQAVIPAGATYRVNVSSGTGSIETWSELR